MKGLKLTVSCRPNVFGHQHKDCDGIILISLDGKNKLYCQCKTCHKKEPK